MAQFHVIAGASERPVHPVIRKIGVADLKQALRQGWDDFAEIPTHAIFVCLIYPIIGLVLGHGAGFRFALVTLVISAVSFPLLVDRDVGALVAVETSVRAAFANPFTMALWGLIVAALLVIGSLPFFFGLAVVMPVLGHATWHLYRKVVEPDLSPRQEHPRPQHKRRYAAQFPAALFAGEDKEPPARS